MKNYNLSVLIVHAPTLNKRTLYVQTNDCIRVEIYLKDLKKRKGKKGKITYMIDSDASFSNFVLCSGMGYWPMIATDVA